MYKKYLLIIGLISFVGTAQEAVHNYGNIQIHNNTSVGFHTNLINDGAFDQNMGLVGFYSETGDISISGAFAPVFYDAEVALVAGVLIDTSIGVNNNANLITGDIITSKSQDSVYSNFMDYSFYTGESSVSKINGYGAMTNKETFMFPVGDDNRLRPLTIESVAINAIAKCAYFFEDPNSSKSLNNNYNTEDKATEFISVSDKEFWRLEGDVPSRVTLTWDEWSNVRALAEFVSDLKVVGWDKAENQWVNLGNTNVTGSMIYGTITSEEIVPNDYEIITIGGNDSDLETYSTIDLDNYFMTPNGDGQNDILELDGVEESPNNLLLIFDRYGVLVYS